MDHHDLGRVLVGRQLLDQLPRGRVPAADDDVVPVARSTHALALLEQVVDEEPDQGSGERGDDRDAEEDQQPADDVADRRVDLRRVARAHHGGDRPVEPVHELAEEPPTVSQRVPVLVALGHGHQGGGDEQEADQQRRRSG